MSTHVSDSPSFFHAEHQGQTSMDGIGGKLRSARQAWKLTLREVEQRTLRLAEKWGNPAYRISASWLDRVERENRGLSATKLIVLASVYSLTPEQLLGMCPPVEAGLTPADEASVPNATLLTEGNLEGYAKVWLPDRLVTEGPAEVTGLLGLEGGVAPGPYRRGVIGLQDRTLEPMIPAGSIVLIDTQKKSIASRRDWNHEFDRPIYFLHTRSGYLCGFCELDRETDWLTVIPHALSFESNRRWKYKKEIEVVGTVVAVVVRRAS